MGCIFVGMPDSCSICLDGLKLGCLENHQHLILTDQGKAELRRILEERMNSGDRYKTKSGNEQRPKVV